MGNSSKPNHLMWIGPLVAVAGLISYFTVFVRWPVLRDFPWVNLPIVLAGVVVSVLALRRALRSASRPAKIFGSLGLGFSLLVAVLFSGYVFVLSSTLPLPTTVTMGLGRAPDFVLTDQRGRLVRLADLRGQRIIVTFFRGFW